MRLHVLVVDPQAICREPIAKLLSVAGYRPACAEDGIAALRAIRAAKPHVVLLELDLPRLAGLELLRVLRRAPQYADLPVIVLTGDARPETAREAAALGVRDYLLKSKFSLDDLLRRVQQRVQQSAAMAPAPAPMAAAPRPSAAGVVKALPVPAPSAGGAAAPPVPPVNVVAPPAPAAARAVPALLTREQVLERVEQCGESKTMAGIVSQIVAMASSPRGEVSDLVSLLKQDVILATRVLQAANTAAFTSKKPRITTIEEAVRNIGLGTVRNIALSVGVYESLPRDAKDGFNVFRCWQHSVAVAGILDRLTQSIQGIAPGMGHVVGLCHDLGEIVLRQCLAEQYDALAEAGDLDDHDGGADRNQVERSAFGISYAELTEKILHKLSLPPAISAPIRDVAGRRRRRGAGGTSPSAAESTLARALMLADEYAHGLQFASSPRALIAPVTVAEYRAAVGASVGAPLHPLAIDGETFRNEVLCNTTVLARLSPSEERELARPLFPRVRAAIWYARHPGLCSFDPLELALRSLADVTTQTRLPSAQEAAACDGLVVAAPKVDQSPLTVGEAERAWGRDKPLLYLGGLEAPGVSASVAELRLYPISLSALAKFVAAGGDAAQRRTSSATQAAA